jgi:acyl-CoA thioesterase YciA
MANTPMSTPQGELMVAAVAMPADANPAGDIFGGWILSQMDIAGGVCASRRARGRCATVAVQEMKFHRPVHVGDLVSCYAHIPRVGRTSITVDIQVWAVSHNEPGEPQMVTEGIFTYVAIDQARKPRPVPPE